MKKRLLLPVLAAGLCVGAPALASPITAHLTGVISFAGINFGNDAAALVQAGDDVTMTLVYDTAAVTSVSPSGPFTIFADLILSVSVSINGGALQMAYDPGGSGVYADFTWLSDDSGSFFSVTDFGTGGGAGGRITGTEVPSSSPPYLEPWTPLQLVIDIGNVVSTDTVPVPAEIPSARIDWRALRTDDNQSGLSNEQSGLYVSFTSATYEGLGDGGDVPAPAGLPLLAAGLLALGLRRRF